MITTPEFPYRDECFICIKAQYKLDDEGKPYDFVNDHVLAGVRLERQERMDASLIILQTGPNEFYAWKDRDDWEHDVTGERRGRFDANQMIQIVNLALTSLRANKAFTDQF